MNKIYYPKDVYFYLENLYHSGKIYTYFQSGKNAGKDILCLRISQPFSKKISAVNNIDYLTDFQPWVNTWRKDIDNLEKIGAVLTGKEKGIKSYYTHIQIPNKSLKNVFHFLKKDDEYNLFIAYLDMLLYSFKGIGFASLFCNDSLIRNWMLQLTSETISTVSFQNTDNSSSIEIVKKILKEFINWFEDYPVTPQYVRNYPLPYVGTKHFEDHLGVFRKLYNLIYGTNLMNADELYKALNLVPSLPNVHDVIFPKDWEHVGIQHLDKLQIEDIFTKRLPEKVLFIENAGPVNQGYNFKDVVVIGSTGNALIPLTELPVMSKVKQVWHWSDADFAGYTILNSMRKNLPSIRSFLMDESLLLYCNKTYLTFDDSFKKQKFNFLYLTNSEMKMFDYLHKNNVRIEQEFLSSNRDIVFKELNDVIFSL